MSIPILTGLLGRKHKPMSECAVTPQAPRNGMSTFLFLFLFMARLLHQLLTRGEEINCRQTGHTKSLHSLNTDVLFSFIRISVLSPSSLWPQIWPTIAVSVFYWKFCHFRPLARQLATFSNLGWYYSMDILKPQTGSLSFLHR